MALPKQFLQTWSNPPSDFRSAPFWSWNSKLEPARLTAAIDEMKRAGMGGFFMHSRYGLKTPYLSEEWFKCITACVEKARQLGMKAYLYDEDRWPSGAAGGLVTRPNKALRVHRLQMHTGEGAQAAPEQFFARGPSTDANDVLREPQAVFALELDDKGTLRSYKLLQDASGAGKDKVVAFDMTTEPPSGWYNDGTYLDTMNPAATAEFIRVTHQAYADRYGKDFGKLIPAIFFDEPNYGHHWIHVPPAQYALPWTPELPREFVRRRGYDLRDRLPELYYVGGEGEFSKVRYDFYRTCTELFVENYTRQIGQWCANHHIALTGHMLCEENFHSQIATIGAAMPHYEYMQWPGIDILTDQAHELSTAKQTASVADQLGKERVLSELYGCTGWDWPLEGHKFVGDWQFAAGVNFRCPHLTHYSLAGGAKRDYPASIFTHSPWWSHYGIVEDYFSRLSFMLTQGSPVRDVLVLHTIESAWGLFAPGQWAEGKPLFELNKSLMAIIRTLSGQHYDWDFADESLLAKHGKVSKDSLKVGRLAYKLVVVPPSITLRASTVAILKRFMAAGGQVVFVGRQPTHVDGAASADAANLVASASTSTEPGMIAAIESRLPRRVSITAGGAELDCTWSMLRQIKDAQVLFIQSHDRKAGHRVTVRVAGAAPAVLWDAMSGKQYQLAASVDGEAVRFDLDLGPTGSAVVTLGAAVPDAAPLPAEPAVLQSQMLAGPYEVELCEPNTLPLDYCQYRFDGQEWSQPVPSLRADADIRKKFGLYNRVGYAHQPWYLYATGNADLAPRGRCQIRRTFHVTSVASHCRLGMEQPEFSKVTVNGQAVGAFDGSWVDADIRTTDVTKFLKPGDNEVLMDFDYRPDMELEDMYLIGDFGVARHDASGPLAPGNLTMTAPVRRLSTAAWVGQGLDFYGGAVKYKLSIRKPAVGRLRVRLPKVDCTAAVIHVNGKSFPLPWAPFEADVTEALTDGDNAVEIEVIGGRKNILGPLHVPWHSWTGPGEFDPDNQKWTKDYLLFPHGLLGGVEVQVVQ